MNTKPVEVFRLQGVSVSIFANPIKDKTVPLYKVSLKKTYVKEGQFKSVTAMGKDDLPIAAKLLEKAWLRILELEDESWSKSNSSDPKSN